MQVLGSAEGGYELDYGDDDITINPHKLQDFELDNNLFLEEEPSYTYLTVYSVKPEIARNLAKLGRPLASRRKPSRKEKPNKFWKNLFIPTWFSQ